MWQSLSRLVGPRRKVRGTTPQSRQYRPSLEGLEDRMVLSSPASLAPPELGAAKVSQSSFNLLDLRITEVAFENGQLIARGTIGGHSISTPIDVSTSPSPAQADCPILNLELNPIHLDLLGLNVDTSAICLRITAHEGEGLLGDLLCGLSGLLDGGVSLGDALGGLSAGDRAALLDGLTDVLNQGVFGPLTSTDSFAGVSGSTCNILNLALGPLDLNLLGLQVELDDCEGGPVTVDITAERGPGKLLGNLLCGLAGLLDDGADLGGILKNLEKVAKRVDKLLGRLDLPI
jgi:hypothetical protein